MLQCLSPQQRLQATLERRLRCAPPEFRTAADVSIVQFEWPEFELTQQQQFAIEAQLRSLADARAAFRGRPDHEGFDPEGAFPSSTCSGLPIDRLAVISEAIANFDRMSRVLRQWGLKLSIIEARGVGASRAELTYRRAVGGRRPGL
jgi:hypothetical protein